MARPKRALSVFLMDLIDVSKASRRPMRVAVRGFFESMIEQYASTKRRL